MQKPGESDPEGHFRSVLFEQRILRFLGLEALYPNLPKYITVFHTQCK